VREAGPEWRVLLVEDNPINQLVARRMLEKFGGTVELAANGQEAVDAAAGGRFDFILMDIQMPIMDGYQATERIRRRESVLGLHTPIIALTANATPGSAWKPGWTTTWPSPCGPRNSLRS
jgi:CheY-like chemotaxis protein